VELAGAKENPSVKIRDVAGDLIVVVNEPPEWWS
jgi:hypothetical protein